MKINDEDLREFIKLYNEAFQEYISEDDARVMASEFVELYTLLAKPPPSELKESAEAASGTEKYKIDNQHEFKKSS